MDSIFVAGGNPVGSIDDSCWLRRENLHLAARGLVPQRASFGEGVRVDASSSIDDEGVVNAVLATSINGSRQALFVTNCGEISYKVERSSTHGLDLTCWNRCGTHWEHI